MASFTDHIDESTAAALTAAPVFFVATATADSRVNLSPKGMDTLRVLGPRRVAYLDLTGSGNETAAHVTADGRITLMVCRFDQKPDIIRLYGRGGIVSRGSEDWDALIGHWDEVIPGARQLITVDVETVQSSCGYAVPRMDFVDHRQTLRRFAESKSDDEIREYRARKNSTSIDGIPAPDPDALV